MTNDWRRFKKYFIVFADIADAAKTTASANAGMTNNDKMIPDE